MPNKIENTLPDDELQQLLADLRALAGRPTLKQVQAAAKKHGVDVSLMGAKSFRDNTFEAHLQRLRRGKEMAEAITGAVREGNGSALDAAEEIAAQELLDALTDVDAEGRPNIGNVSKIIVNLRIAASSRQDTARKISETEAKLRVAEELVKKLRDQAEERDRKKAELLARVESAKKKGGLTKETLAKIEQEAKLL